MLINAFEKQYPDIKVTLVSAPTDTDTNRATLATQISGGSSTPDVFMGDVIWPAQFGAHQLAVPLSEYLPASYWTKFAPGWSRAPPTRARSTARRCSRTRASCTTARTCWRKQHMTPPTTWEQLETDAKTLASYGRSSTGSSGKATRTRA